MARHGWRAAGTHFADVRRERAEHGQHALFRADATTESKCSCCATPTTGSTLWCASCCTAHSCRCATRGRFPFRRCTASARAVLLHDAVEDHCLCLRSSMKSAWVSPGGVDSNPTADLTPIRGRYGRAHRRFGFRSYILALCPTLVEVSEDQEDTRLVSVCRACLV